MIEDVEPRPAAVSTVFADRTPLAERFVEHLGTTGVEWGLLGPREVPRLWTRHVLNCAVLGELLPESSSVVDVGSGAGLPGLALAIARPDLRITLVEPLERRVAWLEEVVDDLAVDVDIRRARAEELAGRLTTRYVTARAVAALPTLAGWGLPLLEAGGEMLAIKGRTAETELSDSAPALRRLGAVDWQVWRCGIGVLHPPTTVVRVRVAATRTTSASRPGRSPRRR